MSITTKETEIIYPDSDGEPMAESTIQYTYITQIKGGCEALLKNNHQAFVAGDLLWYPVKGKPNISQAPDTMIVFGRPKGHRSSYLQWEENNIAPQIVFEIRSHNDNQTKMDNKLAFYQRYNVEEYYLFNPENNQLTGWCRIEGILTQIESMTEWISPRLGIKFQVTENGLELYTPDGEKFLDYVELYEAKERERLEKEREKLGKQLIQEQLNSTQEQLELEKQKNAQLIAKLKALGIEL